jgi:hypothetical protein
MALRRAAREVSTSASCGLPQLEGPSPQRDDSRQAVRHGGRDPKKSGVAIRNSLGYVRPSVMERCKPPVGRLVVHRPFDSHINRPWMPNHEIMDQKTRLPIIRRSRSVLICAARRRHGGQRPGREAGGVLLGPINRRRPLRRRLDRGHRRRLRFLLTTGYNFSDKLETSRFQYGGIGYEATSRRRHHRHLGLL